MTTLLNVFPVIDSITQTTYLIDSYMESLFEYDAPHSEITDRPVCITTRRPDPQTGAFTLPLHDGLTTEWLNDHLPLHINPIIIFVENLNQFEPPHVPATADPDYTATDYEDSDSDDE